jgi:hypothetical protein
MIARISYGRAPLRAEIKPRDEPLKTGTNRMPGARSKFSSKRFAPDFLFLLPTT